MTSYIILGILLILLMYTINLSTPKIIHIPPTNNKIKIILFTSSTCSYCIAFKPEWDKFKLLNLNNIEIIEVNNNPLLLNKYNIIVFPTIIIEKNNNPYIEYKGNRTANDLYNFIKSI